MLLLVERMAVYLFEHPNAVKHIAANCALLDEEFLNEGSFQGAAKLFSTFIPELKAWIDKQRAPDVPGAEEGDMADDDDSDKAEEEA